MQLNDINDISGNIQKAKELIKAADLTVIELDKGYKEPAEGVWQRVRRDFAFGVSDSKEHYNQAKQNMKYMKSLVDDIINGLKNISDNAPEYKFSDYGIEKEFEAFYNHFKNYNITKIKEYTPHKDIETLTGISRKAANIKHDLDDLQKDVR